MTKQETEQEVEEQPAGDQDTQPEAKVATNREGEPLTEAKVARLIKDAKRQERAKYADYDDLKAKAAKADEYEESQQTELEKAQARVEALEAKLSQEAEARKKTTITAELKLQAAQMGFNNPTVAMKLADLSEVSVDENGNVTGIKDALDLLAENEPYLIGNQPEGEQAMRPTAPKTGAGQGSPPRSGDNTLTPAEKYLLEQAQKRGYDLAEEAVAQRKNAIRKQQRR